MAIVMASDMMKNVWPKWGSIMSFFPNVSQVIAGTEMANMVSMEWVWWRFCGSFFSARMCLMRMNKHAVRQRGPPSIRDMKQSRAAVMRAPPFMWCLLRVQMSNKVSRSMHTSLRVRDGVDMLV